MKNTAATAIDPFIPFERTSSTPFYKQIYDGYRAAILSGQLRPGQRLPSTRALAQELKISRLPVINAFERTEVIIISHRRCCALFLNCCAVGAPVQGPELGCTRY